MLKRVIEQVVTGNDLDRAEARAAMETIMRGEASPVQIAGLLVGMRMKGETVDEIVGSAEAMRQAAVRLDTGVEGLVDTCGTGGDGAGTFNISTAAAFVAAGAGVPIAKHGNRAVSSSCGSADVLEGLGVTLMNEPERLIECLQEAGMMFMFAPFQHPAMQHAVGPRRELALRTIFNLLGPLTNPAGAKRQVLGVYDPALVPVLAEVLGELGAERALVVHGAGGIDEISTLGRSRVAEWDGERVLTYEIDPEELGFGLAQPREIAGGAVNANARRVLAVLEGLRGPAADIVLLNAAAAIYAGGLAESIEDGLDQARESIASGAARDRLERLVQCTEPEEVEPEDPEEEEQDELDAS
jgi:anthranilate phosphoribosyltransferase